MTNETAGIKPIEGFHASESFVAGGGDPAHPFMRYSANTLGGLLTAVCLIWILQVPQRLGFAFYTEQFVGLVLGLALATAFHSFNWRGKRHNGLPLHDVALGWIGLLTGLWIASEYPRLLLDVSFRTPEILVLAVIVLVLVLDALRRCTGWALLSIVLFFLAYALVAHLMPQDLRGKPAKLDALVSYLAFDPSAIFGTPMVIGASVVIVFIWMGEVLMRSGGGDWFMDVCMAMFGKARGGPAKVCIVSSALFGMISGSAVSNVVSSGVLTIPLMKRTGYTAVDSGAIEAVSSTGGQITPPVMGAAAFLMAEFLQVTYAEICIAAAIPAALFFWSLYVQVDVVAGQRNLTRLNERVPALLQVMKEGWHLLIPFIVLIYFLFAWDQDPEIAGIACTVMVFVVGMLRPYRGQRIRVSDLWKSLAATGRTTTDLFTTLAAAGIVIGVLNMTGLAFALTLWLVKLGGGSLFLLLVITAFVSFVLGMGMPTTAVYVLLAALVAPGLVQAGLDKMSAHMFILYNGMLSMITPPVALAAYAAANLSGAGAMQTGWACCRIGWFLYIVPFMFVISPGLLMKGDTTSIIIDVVSACVGIHFVTAALVGFVWRDLGILKRMILVLAGAFAIVPETHFFGVSSLGFSLAGIAVGALLYVIEFQATRPARLAKA
ncbi:MAG: TRAP transporter fused permease subunit [Alphaproteobacteria bacterium]|nr:TRAP transporter fused permease subunit [Alphaproteobacteria bacterium]